MEQKQRAGIGSRRPSEQLHARKPRLGDVEMLPIPKHLKEILIPTGNENSENRVDGIIRCLCGQERFHIKTTSDAEDAYAFMVKADCANCNKSYLIFDASKHGWDGFVCHNGVSAPDDELILWHCPKCNNNVHSLKVCVMSQGKQDFIDETGLANGETEFSEDDWVEAFEWITIGLNCCGCGHSDEEWIDLETM